MGRKILDVQNKSKIFAEILRACNTQLKWDKWPAAQDAFKKPPDRRVISVDQSRDVEVALKLVGDKHFAGFSRTRPPRAVDAKADVGVPKWG